MLLCLMINLNITSYAVTETLYTHHTLTAVSKIILIKSCDLACFEFYSNYYIKINLETCSGFINYKFLNNNCTFFFRYIPRHDDEQAFIQCSTALRELRFVFQETNFCCTWVIKKNGNMALLYGLYVSLNLKVTGWSRERFLYVVPLQ